MHALQTGQTAPDLPTAGARIAAPTPLAIFWIAAALVGWVVSFLLYLEYIGQLTHSDPLVSCTFSVVVSCGPNLLSPGGNLLGFSNSILGIILFLGPLYAGVHALAGGVYPRWYWRTFLLFIAAAFVFIHVLAWRSIFQYGVLCPWCMLIWVMTIPLFWCSAGWALRRGVFGDSPIVRRIGDVVAGWAAILVLADYLLIAITAQVRLEVLQSLIR